MGGGDPVPRKEPDLVSAVRSGERGKLYEDREPIFLHILGVEGVT